MRSAPTSVEATAVAAIGGWGGARSATNTTHLAHLPPQSLAMKVSWIGTDLVFSVQEHSLSRAAKAEVNDNGKGGGRANIRDAASKMELQPGLQGELPPESTLRKTLELAPKLDMGAFYTFGFYLIGLWQKSLTDVRPARTWCTVVADNLKTAKAIANLAAMSVYQAFAQIKNPPKYTQAFQGVVAMVRDAGAKRVPALDIPRMTSPRWHCVQCGHECGYWAADKSTPPWARQGGHGGAAVVCPTLWCQAVYDTPRGWSYEWAKEQVGFPPENEPADGEETGDWEGDAD